MPSDDTPQVYQRCDAGGPLDNPGIAKKPHVNHKILSNSTALSYVLACTSSIHLKFEKSVMKLLQKIQLPEVGVCSKNSQNCS